MIIINLHFSGEEDQDIYDISRLRRADMPYIDKGYHLLSTGPLGKSNHCSFY